MSQESFNSKPYTGSQAAPNQVLICQTDDVRPFARLLRGIGLKHNATMSISNAGFTVTVEEVKTLCATAFVPAILFQTFEFQLPPTSAPTFEISLDSLLQCLNIFGNASSSGGSSSAAASTANSGLASGGGKNKRRWAGEGDDTNGGDEFGSGRSGSSREKRTGMRMTWAGHGEPLSIFMQDDGKGPVTTCELNTYEPPDDLMDQPFDHDSRVCRVIMKNKSEWFREALTDLPPSCTQITLTITPGQKDTPAHIAQATSSSNLRRTHRSDVGNFSIKAIGTFGETQLDYPNDKSVMETFEVEEEVSFSYHSSHFGMLSRALQQSDRLSIAIEPSGFLDIQISMPIVGRGLEIGQNQGIIEFKMNPLEEDDD